METQVQIDFRDCDHREDYRERIEELVTELEDRYGRITACRVSVRGPAGRHRTGGPYEIGIHLELPDGRRVDAGRAPHLDTRYGDPWFAINDTFKRARRQLQDNVRRMQGATKVHEEAPVGVVRMIKHKEGFGFLDSSDGREIYFHRNAVLNDGFAKLEVGDEVTFAETMGDNGPQASTVRITGGHGRH